MTARILPFRLKPLSDEEAIAVIREEISRLREALSRPIPDAPGPDHFVIEAHGVCDLPADCERGGSAA